MAISERTRKILWGRSGNRCAMCRLVLVADATTDDPAAVVGDECHILPRSPRGPRGDQGAEGVDAEENLILLCRVDHKRADDQPRYFTAERLRALKLAHETWVHTSLSREPPPILPLRVRRIGARPTSLQLMTSGSELLALVVGAMAYDFDNDEMKNEEEADLIAGFLQSVQDYGEIGSDLEAADRVKARFALGNLLKEINEAGFFVYGGQSSHVLEGGVGPPSQWPIATVRVKRAEDVLLEAFAVVKAQSEWPDAGTAT